MLRKKKPIRRSHSRSVNKDGEIQTDQIAVFFPEKDMVIEFMTCERMRQDTHYKCGHDYDHNKDNMDEREVVHVRRQTTIEYEMRRSELSHLGFPTKMMGLLIAPSVLMGFVPFEFMGQEFVSALTGVGLSFWYTGRTAYRTHKSQEAIMAEGNYTFYISGMSLKGLTYLDNTQLYSYARLGTELENLQTRLHRGEEFLDTLDKDNFLLEEIVQEMEHIEEDMDRVRGELDDMRQTSLMNKDDELSQQAIEFLTNDSPMSEQRALTSPKDTRYPLI